MAFFKTSPRPHAEVAELVDAHGSGPCGRKLVEVRVLSSAPIHFEFRIRLTANDGSPSQRPHLK
ncbi:hypothetical protein THIOKS190125 [Thiocapsa sp. KS1]|nr:hypothetical protein THIOKS190125 [Thiocapsa sp. KS1]